MKLFILTICFLVVSLLGCDNQSDISAPQIESQISDGLIPMKVGYTWIYLTSAYDTTGYQFTYHTIDTLKITRDTLINNELWFVFNDSFIKINRGDGVWYLSKGIPKLNYPLTLNDSACFGTQSDPCGDYLKLVKIDQPITVLGRKYTANVYDWLFQFTDLELGYKRYVANHIGIIREEAYGKTESDRNYLMYSYDLLYFISE